MTKDPRILATRSQALDAALEVLLESGVLAVTHAAVSKATGISRSTLYRHWPSLEDMCNDAFLLAATSPKFAPKMDGYLREELTWAMTNLQIALTETPWGKIAPQVIAAAVTDEKARDLIEGFMQNRSNGLKTIFDAAKERGEMAQDKDVAPLIEMAIAAPYFRKLIAGMPLDDDWLQGHVTRILDMAMG
jgi:AcrR family transcriptional regulator